MTYERTRKTSVENTLVILRRFAIALRRSFS